MNCKHCGQPTPSKTRTCCDNCLSPGVKAALLPQSRAKMSVANKARFTSPEARAERSASASAAWESSETRIRMSVATKARFASPEARADMSARAKAVWESYGHRAKMSKLAAQAVADGKNGYKFAKRTKYTSKAGVKYNIRSTWECKVAEYLDAQSVLWKYESEVFMFGDEAYLPDFLVFNQFDNLLKIIEVKGYFPTDIQTKMARFQKALAAQGVPLEIWNGVKLKELGIL